MQKHVSLNQVLTVFDEGEYKKPVHSDQKIITLLQSAGVWVECVYVHTTELKSSDSTVPYTIGYCWYLVTTANG